MSNDQVKTPGFQKPQSLRRFFGTIKREEPLNEEQCRRLLLLDGAYEGLANVVEQVCAAPGTANSESVTAMRKLLESFDCAMRAVFDTPDVPALTMDHFRKQREAERPAIRIPTPAEINAVKLDTNKGPS